MKSKTSLPWRARAAALLLVPAIFLAGAYGGSAPAAVDPDISEPLDTWGASILEAVKALADQADIAEPLDAWGAVILAAVKDLAEQAAPAPLPRSLAPGSLRLPVDIRINNGVQFQALLDLPAERIAGKVICVEADYDSAPGILEFHQIYAPAIHIQPCPLTEPWPRLETVNFSSAANITMVGIGIKGWAFGALSGSINILTGL